MSIAVAASFASSLDVAVVKLCLKARSQTPINARPCAMLARWATMQGVDASRSLSRVGRVEGFRNPART